MALTQIEPRCRKVASLGDLELDSPANRAKSDNSSLERNRTIHTCKNEHFDPLALTTITQIVDRLRQSKVGCLGPQIDWLNEINIPQA